MEQPLFDPTQDVRDYFNETVTFSLPKKDLFFIGQTLSTKYVNSDVAPFINAINRFCVDATDLDIDVVFTLKIQQLISIIEKLGKEPEFYYSSFNKEVEAKLIQAISEMEDEGVQGFLIYHLTQRKGSIESYKNSLVQQFIHNQGLN